MIEQTISAEQARRWYDRAGRRLDWADHFESRAKTRAIELLDLSAGQRVINVGVGTGTDHQRIVAAVKPGGVAMGVDISPVMVHLARQRTGAPVHLADCRQLPVASGSQDRLFCAYLLDLMPAAEIPSVLREFRRVLRREGVLVLVSLSDEAGRVSRAVMGLWKTAYRAVPTLFGGCRPLGAAPLVAGTGFEQVHRELVTQRAIPSEIVTALA